MTFPSLSTVASGTLLLYDNVTFSAPVFAPRLKGASNTFLFISLEQLITGFPLAILNVTLCVAFAYFSVCLAVIVIVTIPVDLHCIPPFLSTTAIFLSDEVYESLFPSAVALRDIFAFV